MSLTRRRALASLGVSALGAGALAACTPIGRRGRSTTPPPTASDRTAPTSPLVIGSIGSGFGEPGQVETQIRLAVGEAVERINTVDGGLFGQDVELVERIVLEEPGDDPAEQIEALAAQGVQVLVSSLEDAQLIAALPTIVARGMAVLCPWSSSKAVREQAEASGLLFRLVPPDEAIAAAHVEAALTSPPKGTTPGTVFYVAPDTTAGRSLRAELELQLNPAGGTLLEPVLYPPGEPLAVADIAARVLAAPPALLILQGGPECGPLASAVHEGTKDASGRSQVSIRTRMGPAASVDYSRASLPAESLSDAEGTVPGALLSTGDFADIMLNLDTTLVSEGFAFGQQAYDAVVIACLAAQRALSIVGSEIAAEVPAVLTGSSACEAYYDCRQLLSEGSDVAYSGMSGQLELDSVGDLRSGELRRITWDETGARVIGDSTTRFTRPG
ncbi:ABC transporter substrate-binding protein [Brachybacterium hainanense]|uniref:ABC transporter substrate-binding protein n=1 Tax=Brachybacterium hainanense TaxID=1541174 RepID=A0ABV6RCY4_9MICO